MFRAVANTSLQRISVAASGGRYIHHYAHASNEDQLQQILIKSPPSPYDQFVAREWSVHGKSHLGKGDLVFKRPDSDMYLIVEAKCIINKNGSRKGHSKKRAKAGEQAERYGRNWKEMYPRAYVQYATYTNEEGLVPLGEIWQDGRHYRLGSIARCSFVKVAAALSPWSRAP